MALDLHGAGVQVEAVVDLRPEGEESELGEAVRNAGIAVHAGHCVYEAIPAKKGVGVGGAAIAPLDVQDNPVPSRASRSVATGSP